MSWTVQDQVGDLPSAIAYFHSRLPGWWFSVGACHVTADATVCPDTAGVDAWLFQTGDCDVTKFFDEGFDADLYPPATMADALIRATHMAYAARSAYCVRNCLADARAALVAPTERRTGKDFKDTFSAETVLLDAFWGKKFYDAAFHENQIDQMETPNTSALSSQDGATHD